MGVRDLTRVFVPLAKGLDQSRDDYTKAADVPVRLENGQLEKSGRFTKRRGFERVPILDQDGAAVTEWRGCFSTGSELCLIGRQYLYGYNETWGNVLIRGPVAPFDAHQQDIWRDEYSYIGSDCAATNGYTLHAAVRHRATGTAYTDSKSLAVAIESSDGSRAVARTGNAPFANILQVRAFHVNKKLGLLVAETASPGNLKWILWDTESPTVTNPSASSGTSITTDLPAISDRRNFDAIGLPDGTCAVAYIDNTLGNVNVAIYDDSMSATIGPVTITTNAPYVRCALSWDAENKNLNVLALAAGTEGNQALEAWSLVGTDLSSNWGPISIATEGVSETFDHIGCASANGRMMCAWMAFTTQDTEPYGLSELDYADIRLSDGGDSNLSNTPIFNAFPLSRPFYLEENFYIAGGSNCSALVWSNQNIHDVGGSDAIAAPYEVNAVWRLPAGDQTHWSPDQSAAYPHLVAALDVGAAVGTKGQGPSTWAGDTGALQNVIVDTNDDGDPVGFRVVLPAESFVVYDDEGRYRIAELTLDPTALPNALGTGDGAAVIGGALTCWYDGEFCTELHVLVPPIFRNGDQRNDGNSPGLSGGSQEIYYWIGIWSAVDAQGRVHRSMPSLPIITTFDASDTDETYRMDAAINPVTNRHLVREAQWLVFRSQSIAETGVYRRAMQSLRRVPDRTSANSTVTWDDFKQVDFSEDESEAVTAIPLYTTGGNIETVAPEGCNAMAIVGGRLWLGDFPRRVRVQYSKPFRAGTGTEDLIAPEFNEAFQYVLERGARVTGLADLDGRTLIFTDVDIWVNAGNGPTDSGDGNDFTGPVRLNSDTGCRTHRSVVSMPQGVMFQGERGIYLMSRSQEVQFVGYPVVDETAAYPDITSAVLMPSLSQVRFTCRSADGSEGIVLIYDYAWGAWYKWTVKDRHGHSVAAVGACEHDGRYFMVEANGTLWEQSDSVYYDDSQSYVSMVIKTAPVSVSGPGGWDRFKRIMPLCRREDGCDLHVDLYRDYAVAASEARKLTSAQIALLESPDERVQPKLVPAYQKAQAMAVEVYDTESDDTDPSNGQGFSCSGIMLGVQPKRTPARIAKQGRL